VNQKGFTLIEILIAITIMSFLVLGVYSMVDSNFVTQTEVTREDREYLQVQMAVERIAQDLEQIYSPLYFSAYPTISPNQQNQQNNFDGGYDVKTNNFPTTKYFPKEQVSNLPVPLLEQDNKDELIFFTTAHRRRLEGEKSSRYVWVRYFIDNDTTEEDENEENKRPKGLSVLKRKVITEDLYRDDIDWDKGPEQVLMRGVKSFAFEFWNRKTEKWVQRLRELDGEDKEIPRMFRLLLVMIDQAGNEYNHMRVIKPHWPFFDAAKEQKMLDLANKKKPGNQNQPNSNSPGTTGDNNTTTAEGDDEGV
jgi:prepilin-type N-terminal cleavage/methylation domain-containing protein